MKYSTARISGESNALAPPRHARLLPLTRGLVFLKFVCSDEGNSQRLSIMASLRRMCGVAQTANFYCLILGC